MSVAFDITRDARATRVSEKALPWSVISAGSKDDTQELRQAGITLRFGRNETIFSEGDEAKYSYKVLSGVIRLCKHMADGRRQIAEFVQPGDYCGLLNFGEHRFTAEAVSEVTVTAISQRQVETLGENTPAMRKWMTGFLTRSLMGMQDHLVMLGRQTAKERVVSFLLMLADRAGAEDGDAVELPMNRQDIADYLGLTIETVCRVLSDLKRCRIIGLPNLHQAILTNMDALHDLADGE